MSVALAVYCIVAAGVIAGLLGLRLRRTLAARRKSKREVLRERYLRTLLQALVSGTSQVPAFILIRNPEARMILAEVLSGVVAATYGLDTELLREVVIRYRLEELLLLHARRSSGYMQAYYLSLLASLPVRREVVAQVATWSHSPNRYVRFYAMLVPVAADASVAVRLMEAYPESFSAFEIAEITSLLRRGVFPVAYEPLVSSHNRNLCAVGLSVVRQFGIEEAEDSLLQIVARDDAPELSREALYTLCSLQRSLEHGEVMRCVARMDTEDRRALLRYMALEGYASHSLKPLFDEKEYPYSEALVESYKRCLVCS